MSNHIEHFDVSRIVSIELRKESSLENFTWTESEPIKRFFGLIDTGRFTEAGWIDSKDYYPIMYTDDDLRGYGYKVYLTSERLNERVCDKAYVKVYLTHDNEIVKRFETDSEAEEWIDLLKQKSGKTFETVIYGS